MVYILHKARGFEKEMIFSVLTELGMFGSRGMGSD